jgi:dihydroorotate dehydrogenase electron transfer subunit
MASSLKLPVFGREEIKRDYFVLEVESESLAPQCRPGVFFELKADVPSQARRLYKPVSVYRAGNGRIAFLIKKTGPGTEALFSLQRGGLLNLIGPLGNGFPLCEGRNVLLVSGGVGYPPLAYLKEALQGSNRITFIHGGACAEHMFPCDLAYTIDGSFGRKGMVTDDIEGLIKDRQIDVVYSCGPVGMLKALSLRLPLIEHYVSLEAYLACGVGVCHGCAVPVGETYIRVCKDGPVFNAADLRWSEM